MDAAKSITEVAQGRARPIHQFTFPEKVAGGKYKTIGLVQLTTEEERAAYATAGEDAAKVVQEQMKTALVRVNGQPVSYVDGTADAVIEDMNPVLRTLVFAAYQQLHVPEKKVVESFLESQAASIG